MMNAFIDEEEIHRILRRIPFEEMADIRWKTSEYFVPYEAHGWKQEEFHQEAIKKGYKLSHT